VLSVEDTLTSDEYDEFGLLYQNAAEWDLPLDTPPAVSRHSIALPSGEALSYLRWGEGEPELLLLHGSGQNAHSWDTVALALGRPAIALDLPGHGLSDRRADGGYGPWQAAESVADFLEAVMPAARCVAGALLGGATTIRLAAHRPDVCRRAVLVNVTPQIAQVGQTLRRSERGSIALLWSRPVYDTFDEMADAAIALSPLESVGNTRREVRHNARRMADGRWCWRFDSFATPGHAPAWIDWQALWQDVDLITVPTLLVRGMLSPFVRDEDVEEMRRRLPSLQVVEIEGAAHSAHTHRPLAVADAIEAFVYR
jgi:pimeloyl-ACP methyl ester carboxylesterase